MLVLDEHDVRVRTDSKVNVPVTRGPRARPQWLAEVHVDGAAGVLYRRAGSRR
jgi:hypothetical protein